MYFFCSCYFLNLLRASIVALILLGLFENDRLKSNSDNLLGTAPNDTDIIIKSYETSYGSLEILK